MIYLLRHAETEWNFQMRKQGLDDSPLTPRGRDQAAAYGELLACLFEKDEISSGEVLLHASPLGRTKATAKYLIDALDIPKSSIYIESRLIEFDYGHWSGKTNEEIESEYPGMLKARENDKWNFIVPGGESYQDVEKKIRSWMSDLPQDRTVVVVTHSVVSRVIRGIHLSLPRIEAGSLEHPQDAIFRLSEGTIDVIEIRSKVAVS